MPNSYDSDWNDLPVWRCSAALCGEQWATEHEDNVCPFCHCETGQKTDFTYGDLAQVADKFGFQGDLPVHVSDPVPDLVQLSTLSPDLWLGLPVFHPFSQTDNQATWLLYDVGVIIAVYPDPHLPGELRCRFLSALGGRSCTLEYSPSNLWVPSTLAQRLA